MIVSVGVGMLILNDFLLGGLMQRFERVRETFVDFGRRGDGIFLDDDAVIY